MTGTVDVALPAGWYPLGPVPGALLAAAAVGRDGRAVATLLIRMLRCPGLTDAGDAAAVLAAVAPPDTHLESAQDVRWCGPESVAVLVACAAPGEPVSADDLAAALGQTALYAVDSTGRAIRSSSADDAKAGCRGSTRTV